ncbi:hypothetical protein RN001_001409 [Aquatica leii]|uniref:Antistasin-like domain-containing protein n=1 Tax=Aquatica leii TaxID=1421715 RepID=A0AAN7QMV4_9COLE|nr:hypothetical protein RN001_001409 [Aquatica leii]
MFLITRLVILCYVICQCKTNLEKSNLIVCPAIHCLPCKYGHIINPNGCITCKCIDPCNGRCTCGESCDVKYFCTESWCIPIGTCISKCKPIACLTIKCAYGLAVDECGCEICSCKTCKCAKNDYCKDKNTPTICVPCPVPKCPKGIFCSCGFQRDQKGCLTCKCTKCLNNT